MPPFRELAISPRSPFPFFAFVVITNIVVASQSLGQSPGWTNITPPSPSARLRLSLAFDPIRNRTLLFGGSTGSGHLDDTWEWDGTRWHPFVLPGPSARSQHAMVFDTTRNRVVLYGGYNETSSLNDTWEWDGASWELRSTTGPARSGFGMAYDLARNRTVIFGGYYSFGATYQIFNDTWEWDGASWTQASTTGPASRYWHSMAYDALRSKVVLFGGQDLNPTIFGDTWEWDGVAWTQMATTGPQPRRESGMTFNPVGNQIVLAGGRGTSIAYPDRWAWNGVSWTQLTSGLTRYAHGLAFDVGRSLFVSFGGTDNFTPSDELWESYGSTWSLRRVNPPARRDHSMAYDPLRDHVMVFGGETSDGLDGKTWEWNTTWWEDKNVFQTSCRNSAMTFNASSGTIHKFGGVNAHDISLGRLHSWNGSVWTQLSTVGPIPRSDSAMAFDSMRGRLVLFGGVDAGNSALGDTWEWDGAAWSLVATTGPSPRMSHGMVFDASRGHVVLFGGHYFVNGNETALGDTWEWDGTQWSMIPITGPPARSRHSMAYDSNRACVVLYGGRSVGFATYDDTWELTGDTWIKRMTNNSGRRFDSAMVYDSARGSTVLFGGTVSGSGTWTGDTWEYRGFRLGDMNMDGLLDGRDLQPFLDAITRFPTNWSDLYLADLDGSATLSDYDVPLFVDALLNF